MLYPTSTTPSWSGPPMNPISPITACSNVRIAIQSQAGSDGARSMFSIKEGRASARSGPGQCSGTFTPSISTSLDLSFKAAFLSSSENGISCKRFVSSVGTMITPFVEYHTSCRIFSIESVLNFSICPAYKKMVLRFAKSRQHRLRENELSKERHYEPANGEQ